MWHAVTCVTGAATDETAAPHDGRRGRVHADVGVGAAAVARSAVAEAAVRCAVHAVAAVVAVHDDDPWQPSCSWSDCPGLG